MQSDIKLIPAKRFFVDMLTRDIELIDAVLDLLDNCLDGAMRSSRNLHDNDKPYEGFSAEIIFNPNQFIISDNCGGIPKDIAINSAFRMGRADLNRDADIPTVGVYGIGMKRSIFKLGEHSEIISQSADDAFQVTITKEWMNDDDAWTIPLTDISSSDKKGTKICVTNLRPGVSRAFSENSNFEKDLKDVISSHYAYIIKKGFKVSINGVQIREEIDILNYEEEFYNAEKESISPFLYKNEIDGVSVKLAIGFYRGIPTDEEEEQAKEGKLESRKAGWTIICNDRVVLHNDKTRLTGWGEAGVPQYHTQFIGIAGVVIFQSNTPSKLPIKTTKRGVDANSELYSIVKEFMREGLKTFTDFTNKWKSRNFEKQYAKASQTVSKPSVEVFDTVPQDKFATVRKDVGGLVYRPNLPAPSKEVSVKRIQFTRKVSEIKAISQYFFDDQERSASEVGERCFDDILKRL